MQNSEFKCREILLKLRETQILKYKHLTPHNHLKAILVY